MNDSDFEPGDTLVAIGGNRRVIVENRDGVLWAVPVTKNSGMDPMKLQDWLNCLMYGAKVVKTNNA